MSSSRSPSPSVGPHALDDLLQRGGGAVGALDGLEDGLPRRDAERDVERQGLAQLVDQQRIGGVGGRDGQGRALEGDGAGRVLPQVLGGEVLQHGRREGQLLGGEEREPALGGERPQHVVLGGGAQLDQGIADPLRASPARASASASISGVMTPASSSVSPRFFEETGAALCIAITR